MGNSESVTIDIKVEWENGQADVVHAGKRLQGEVIVTVKEMTDGSSIKLIISGKERVGLKIRKRDQMVLTQAERRFFSVTIPLAFHEQRRIRPGIYKLPFSIRLPRSLPSSDSHPLEKKNKVGYSIQYRMTAKMGKLYKELYFDVVSMPLRPENVPCLIQPTQHRIQSMGLKEEGQVLLGALVRNSTVGRGKNVELVLACRNDSAVNIRCVEIQVVEFLRWTLGPKPETTDVTKVLKTVKSVELPSTCKAKPRSEVGNISTKALFREIHEELRSRREPILIRIPETARDTYKGRLISVWHCLKITFQTRSLTNNATAVVPIQIGTPPVKRLKQQMQTAPSEAYPMSGMIPVAPGELSTVPEDDEEAPNDAGPIVIAPDDLIILGSASIQRRSDPDASSVVTAPPERVEVEVSIKSLLTSMESSVNDYDLIYKYLRDRRWAKLFSRMPARDYGQIISNVKVEVDQTRVAVLLAPHVNGGQRFTCEFAAAAVKNCSASYRSVTTKRLLPLCVDIKENHNLLLKELNEWERIATNNEFEDALQGTPIRQ
ncbi:hypothetical protein ACA910_021120 [Epithemia clementina (nom. ined.)]